MECPECSTKMEYITMDEDSFEFVWICPQCGEKERDDVWHQGWERDNFGD